MESRTGRLRDADRDEEHRKRKAKASPRPVYLRYVTYSCAFNQPYPEGAEGKRLQEMRGAYIPCPRAERDSKVLCLSDSLFTCNVEIIIQILP